MLPRFISFKIHGFTIVISKEQVPHKPGIYFFKDQYRNILYVGKAIDLYSRVSSYFRGYEEASSAYHKGTSSAYFKGASGSFKTAALVVKIREVETIIVESELEALILEANLIKKYLPPFNIRLTDDKDYLYIAITREDFPRVITARKKDLPVRQAGLAPIKEYFGPFPSSTTVKNTLKQLRRIFPWCQTGGSRWEGGGSKKQTNHRPCFYYHLNLCPGACAGVISKEDYNKIINRFIKFLSGKKQELLEELSKEMEENSDNLEFEEAQRIKKIITGIEYLTQINRTSEYLANPNFLEEEAALSLEALQKDLNLANLPERIECYDISNIQGKEATGSLVVLTSGEIDKSQYRRFKIKIAGKPNDYAMHAEMMRRRLGHPEWPLPDLILIDGGRGQARSAYKELVKKNLSVPIYGIAKRFEWLYPPDGDIVKLPKRSLSIRLIQKIRDEAHRFAITYHRKLRQKAFLPR